MENQETSQSETPTIKHIVCSGGGLAGFAFYGALKESNQKGLWKRSDIQTIYGTSVGTIVAAMLALDYDWETLDDYLIKRPWQTVFTFNLYTIFDTYNNKGILGIEVIQDIFLPLFNGKDIKIDITLLEFYHLTGIEIHMCSTNINSFELSDISYKTHPDWTVIEAIYSSCAVPLLFSPLFKNNECYCDGGLIANYPLAQSIKNGSNPDEILGIKYKGVNTEESYPRIINKTTLFEYMIAIINKLIGMILVKQEDYKTAYEYSIWCQSLSIFDLMDATSNIEIRKSLIQRGIDAVHTE